MVKALNYSRQASAYLKSIQKRSELNHKGEEFERLFALKELKILEHLESATKFILPECGLYFSEKAYDLNVDDNMLHLPFETVIVEYTFPKEAHHLREGTSYSTKRIIILQEEQLEYSPTVSFSGITAITLAYIDQLNMWVLVDGKVMFPKQGDHTKETLYTRCMFTKGTENPLILIPCLRKSFSNRVKSCNNDVIEAAKQSLQDSYDEIIAVTHFLNVVSCSNVEIKELPSRQRPLGKLGKGKKEYYDTLEKDPYHILQVKPEYEQTHKNTSKEYQGIIRQHLRRGHIRRLPSGNIWVTSCIVGNPDKGVITKDYLLSK